MADATNIARASPSPPAGPKSPSRASRDVDACIDLCAAQTRAPSARDADTARAETTDREAKRAKKEAAIAAERARKAAEREAKERVKAEKKAEVERLKAEREVERERVKAKREAERQAKHAEAERIKAEKVAETERRKAEKEAERAAKCAEAERLKAEKEAERAAEKAARDAEKAARDAEKARRLAEKEAEKEAREAEKRKVHAKKEKEANMFAKFFTPAKTKAPANVETPGVKTPKISSQVAAHLDDILRNDSEAPSVEQIRDELTARWRMKPVRMSWPIVNRWGARRVASEVEVVSMICFSLKKRKRDQFEAKAKTSRKMRLFQIDVGLYERPAFWSADPFPNRPAKPSVVSGRAPFKQEADVDYEYDSAEEWEDADPGESLSDKDEDEDEEMAPCSDDEDDDFIAVDDEIIDDAATLDPMAIGDDEETARQRSTVAMFLNRAKRSGEPLVISSLTPRPETSEDPALLRIFKIETPFPNTSRIGNVASTSKPETTTKASKEQTKDAGTRVSPDQIVQSNLRMLVEFLLRNPSLKVNQAKQRFVEEACSVVAGLNQSAVKRKILEIATYSSKMWVVTTSTLQAVGMDENAVSELRAMAAHVSGAAKPPKSKRQKVNDGGGAMDAFVERSVARELPQSTDSLMWTQALESVIKSKDSKSGFPQNVKHMFEASNLRLCVQRGVVPDFFVSFLIKSCGASTERVSFRIACKQALVCIIRALSELGTESLERKLTTPARASIEAACHGDALRKAIIDCVENAEQNDSLRLIAVEILAALALSAAAQGFFRSLACSKSMMVCLTNTLMKRDESSRSAMVVLSRAFEDETSIETCSALRPAEFLDLSTQVAKTIRYPLSMSDSAGYTLTGLRLLHKFVDVALSSTDVQATRSTLVTLLEACLASHDEVDAEVWNEATITLLRMIAKSVSSLKIDADETKRLRNSLNALRASKDTRVAQLVEDAQNALENAILSP